MSGKANTVTPVLEASALRKGDIVSFGFYRNPAENAGIPLEWLVLEVSHGSPEDNSGASASEVSGGKEAFLVARYALAFRRLHQGGMVNWKDCELRAWLNGAFLEESFSPEERKLIKVSRLDNKEHPRWDPEADTAGVEYPKDREFCPATLDRVFLLSSAETERYFESVSSRLCKAAPFVSQRTCRLEDGYGGVWWWLRSPGASAMLGATVADEGLIDDGAYTGSIGGVRPALRIKLPA